MPGKPPQDDNGPRGDCTGDADRPTLTDRLNKYLLCAYLNRLNEEDAERLSAADDEDSRDSFSD